MGVYIPYTRLPSAYQEVEYIQNSGNLYINSGYAPNQDTKAELKFSNWTEIGSYDVFGTDKNFANSGFTLLSTVACYGNQTVDVSKNVADGNLHIITLGKDGYVVDGEFITAFNTQTFTSLNLYLFALNRNGSAREYAHYRFYYMKIWNNGTLVRDFIPCYRKSDNVIGLYDLVNSVFYTSSGTGTFSKGNNVYMSELKNAYIGEVWTPGANTLLYLPLNSTDTYTDKSGNNRGTTNYSVTFGTNYGVDCGYFNGSSAHIQINPFSIPAASTILARFYRAGLNDFDGKIFDARDPRHIIVVNSVSGEYTFGYLGNTAILSSKLIQNQRCLSCLKTNGSSGKLMLLGNNVNTTVSSSVSVSTGTPSYINIGNEYNNGANRHFLGGLSNIIVENRERTDQEVQDYYNSTKSKYGL